MQGTPSSSASGKRKAAGDEDSAALCFSRRSATPSSKRRRAAPLRLQNGPPKYNFRVLLPNATTISFNVQDDDADMTVGDFIRIVRRKLVEKENETAFESGEAHRKILWGSQVYLDDLHGNRIEDGHFFDSHLFKQNRNLAVVVLHDGCPNSVHSYKDLWDVTPDPSLLGGMPSDYSFETALADLIDNSLQAVWDNKPDERRLISLEIGDREISIFDSGQGMDTSNHNCIENWGRMGSSMNKKSRIYGVGGKPPYLKPFFGMYGCGGVLASLHLGGLVTVSSKTKAAKRVATLKLEKEALVQKTKSNRTWKTEGTIRDASAEELKMSPHGSFTKVHIAELKTNYWKEDQLRCMLKDIYFPYIQNDESDGPGHISTPVEFEVNGTNLTEVAGGEIATTNLTACNGPKFEIEIRLTKTKIEENRLKSGPACIDEANAKLSCLYFPIIQGKESLEKALKTEENFETSWRVSIRRLGRLLPDAQWGRLPFMEAPRSRRGEKPQIPVQCFKRVKCFIETDAGFVPTPSKTDLCHKDPFTLALQSLGRKYEASKTGIKLKIEKNEETVTPMRLDEDYYEWIQKMHESYDEEVECSDESPTLLIKPCNWKDFGFSSSDKELYSSNVIRVIKKIKRKEEIWTSSQRIKILKGACGLRKKLYATLEYILCEGLEGDPGEARMICRPINVAEDEGSKIVAENENPSFQLGSSVSFPLDLISYGKCEKVDEIIWKKQLEDLHLKTPSFIEVLTTEDAGKFGISKGLHSGETFKAGSDLPDDIIAVVRPRSFTPDLSSRSICSTMQKYIYKESMEMFLEFKYVGKCQCCENCCHKAHEFSMPSKAETRNQIAGIYLFPLMEQYKKLTKVGNYRFLLSLVKSGYQNVVPGKVDIRVEACDIVGNWKISNSLPDNGVIAAEKHSVRLGSEIGPFYVSYFDPYANQVGFKDKPMLELRFQRKEEDIDIKVCTWDRVLTKDRMHLKMNISLAGGDINILRPTYEAFLKIIHKDLHPLEVPLKVLPGQVKKLIILDGEKVEKILKYIRPGDVIQSLCLQGLDDYGNVVDKGQMLHIDLKGLSFQDQDGYHRKVDEHGCVNLGGLLKVVGKYGSTGSIRVSSETQVIFNKEFQVLSRELRLISEIAAPVYCASVLENVEFGVFDEEGIIDEETNGLRHTLVLNLGNSIQYTFMNGKCKVPNIRLPKEPETFELRVHHALHTELARVIQIELLPRPTIEKSLVFVHDELQEVAGCEYSFDAIPSDTDLTPMKTETRKDKLKDEIAQTLVQDFIKKLDIGVAEITKLGEQIRELEMKENALNIELAKVDTSLNDSQRELRLCNGSKAEGPDSYEEILKQIRKTESAASTWVNFTNNKDSHLEISRSSQSSHLEMRRNVVGVVSLLGIVKNELLDKVEVQLLNQALSEYLGTENLLAIACKNKAGVESLEQYDCTGKPMEWAGIHCLAQEQNERIKGRFRVFCLDGLRSFMGDFESDSQKRLVIENPKLPNGSTPPGFIGYAANMIEIKDDSQYPSGVGAEVLRGTLFFHLFSYLQVYRTREDLLTAASCIKDAAISLDGGLIREQGVIECGERTSSVLRFPTTTCENMNNSYKIAEIDSSIKEKNEQRQKLQADLLIVTRKTKKLKEKVSEKKREVRSMETMRSDILKNYKNIRKLCLVK